MFIKIVVFISLLSFFLACHEKGGHSHGSANAYMHQSKFEDLVQRFEDPKRAEWQQPEAVMRYLGAVKDQTIMDIGCGTGYFSIPLAQAGAKVIAADVDQRFLDYTQKKRDSLQIPANRLSFRKLPYDSPQLSPGEADKVMMTNVYHHIEARPAYFSQVRAGLKPGGQLIIIDFVKKETPHGPPLKMRMSAEEVKEELQKAGFKQFNIESDLLPEQYILIAFAP